MASFPREIVGFDGDIRNMHHARERT